MITVSSRLAEVMSRDDINGAAKGLDSSGPAEDEARLLLGPPPEMEVLPPGALVPLPVLPEVDEAAAEAAAVACFVTELEPANDADGFS